MTTERRTTARGKTTAKVTFTDATSDTPNEGELHDIGRGGMFVATKTPLPTGKRIDVEVHATGSAPITGMARVIWVREAATGELPAGMGIKFIDVDNDALVAIDRLVGLKKNVRERTVLGIAGPVVPPKAEPPKVEAKVEAPKVEAPKVEAPKVEPPRPLKSRERTVLGIAPPAQPREKELSWPDDPPPAPEEPPPPPAPAPAPKIQEASAPAIEVTGEQSMSEPVNFSEPALVLPKEEPVKVPEPEPVKAPEPEPVKAPEPEPVKEVAVAKEMAPPEPRELPKRESGGGGKWLVILLLLGGAAGAAYYFRDKIFPPPDVLPTPSATPSASASAAPSASASAAPTASVVETVDASLALAEDASTLAATDAGTHDASHDAGDAGKHHDAGAAGATSTHAQHPKPKPTATATTADNPY